MPTQQIQASGPDEYAYVTVPTTFTEDKWVVAAELRPDNRKIVHHAHVFVVEPEPQEAAVPHEKDPAAEYGKWLLVKQGTLEFMRPEAPVIDDGCVRHKTERPWKSVELLSARARARRLSGGYRTAHTGWLETAFPNSLLAHLW
jgi:hypothetical protein